MRNLHAATFFAVSALAAPIATKVPRDDMVYSKIVPLPLPDGEDGFEIVTLVFRLDETEKACDPSSLSINGQQLPHNEAGYGTGTIDLDNHQSMAAEWRFRCVDEVAEVMDLIVHSFNGDEIPDVSLSTRYSTPSRVMEMSDPRVNDSKTPTGTKQKASHGMSSCKSLRCYADVMMGATSKAAKMVNKKISTGSQQKTVNNVKASSAQVVQEFESQKDIASQRFKEIYEKWEHQDILTDSLFGPLFVAIIAFSFFSFFSIIFANRERIRVALAERRARRAHLRERRHRTWAERRAARAERRRAVRDFICRLFKNLLDPDAEKRAAEEERRRHLIEVDTRRQENNNTMEEELAGFRAAAAMVGDLVAAEEGRHQRRAAPHGEPAPPPVPPRPPMSVFVPHDEPLPAYEQPLHEAATVADGFRYVPTSPEQTLHEVGAVADGFRYVPTSPEAPLLPSSHESSSDRLGYGK